MSFVSLFGYSILLVFVSVGLAAFFSEYKLIIVSNRSNTSIGCIDINSDDNDYSSISSDSIEETSAVHGLKPGGVVIVCDAGKGFARETAIYLASKGFHVLAGVRDKNEVKSFVYDTAKGIEPIVLDIANPSDIAKVIYRTKELKRDLDRPLTAIIVNSIDSINDLIASTITSDKKANEAFTTFFLEDSYKLVLKQPYRMLDAFSQYLTSEYNVTRIYNSTNSSVVNSTATPQIHGRFIVVVPQNQISNCGVLCALSSSVSSFYSNIHSSFLNNGIFISVVQLDVQNSNIISKGNSKGNSKGSRKGNSRGKKVSRTRQVPVDTNNKPLDVEKAGEVKAKKLDRNAMIVLHSLLSKSPDKLHE